MHWSLPTVFAAMAAAQSITWLDTPNPDIDILSCEALPCDPTGNNICATNGDSAEAAAVGIAPEVVKLDSGAGISLVLIDGLEEEQSDPEDNVPSYEYTTQQLFVGIDPDLSNDEYPTGCVLMFQYKGQTFPLTGERADAFVDTTSCEGVLAEQCEADMLQAIQSFDRSTWSNENSDGDDVVVDDIDDVVEDGSNVLDMCQALADHVNSQLRQQTTCGDRLISSLINVSGGALPEPGSNIADDDQLAGVNECRPVLPQQFNMHKATEMGLWYFEDVPAGGSEFYGPLFGGRSGYTPVVAVTYSDDGTQAAAQFVCMKTWKPDGSAVEDVFQIAGADRQTSRVIALLSVTTFAILFSMGMVSF